MTALPSVTRWTPTVADVLRQAGVPTTDVAQYTAATLALIHYESRGNPEAQHGATGAYGLTQQIKRWHPQHRGDPRAHLLHYAQRLRATTKPGAYAAGSVQSFLQAWASGPPALRFFVENGRYPDSPPQMPQQVRNVRDMVAGSTWSSYASYVAAWISAGQPTSRQEINGRAFEVSPPGLTGVALASPSDGFLYYRGQKRKISDAGPGGITGLDVRASAKSSKTTTWALLLLGLAGVYLFVRGAK